MIWKVVGLSTLKKEPSNCVTYVFGVGVPAPDSVALVGIEGGTDVPAVKSMG